MYCYQVSDSGTFGKNKSIQYMHILFLFHISSYSVIVAKFICIKLTMSMLLFMTSINRKIYQLIRRQTEYTTTGNIINNNSTKG